MKQLPLQSGTKSVGRSKSYPYDLTSFADNYSINLYDYKLKTNLFKYIFENTLANEEKPADLGIIKDKLLAFNEPYRTEIIDSKIFNIENKESYEDEQVQLEKYGGYYKEYEKLYINEKTMQESTVIEKDDLQLLNAIYCAYLSQYNACYYSSGTNFMTKLRDFLGIESVAYEGAQGFLNILKARLDLGEAPTLSMTFDGSYHAVNAISLIQDAENSNVYHIGVYDNNYPGEKRYVTIENKNDCCLTVENDYYSYSGEPIRITISLEADLEYFNKGRNAYENSTQNIAEVEENITQTDESDTNNDAFYMIIEDTFDIINRGTVVSGTITRGSIKLNDKIQIVGRNHKTISTKVLGIELFTKSSEYAKAGDRIGIVLENVSKSDVERGQVAIEPDSVKPTKKFEASIQLLTKEEEEYIEPIKNNDERQIYFGVMDSAGVITLPNNMEKIDPGEKSNITVDLEYSMPIEIEQEFIIRVGGKVLARGKVTKIY